MELKCFGFICYAFVIVLIYNVTCEPVLTNFNTNLRDYSANQHINTTNVKTLQKEELARYANFAPVQNAIKFKEVPDNALSSSSYSRGLVHHDHGGYTIHEYDDNPHDYGYGYHHESDHSNHPHDSHHGYYDDHFGHGAYSHGHGHGHGHHGHDHHHKHIDSHALAAKTILWPIAGIALLGAAAALVSNPVLLQLGVVSGRKKRETEEVIDPALDMDFDKRWQNLYKPAEKPIRLIDKKRRHEYLVKLHKDHKEALRNVNKENNSEENKYGLIKSKYFKDVKQRAQLKKVRTEQLAIDDVTVGDPENYRKEIGDGRFVPVPLKIRQKT